MRTMKRCLRERAIFILYSAHHTRVNRKMHFKRSSVAIVSMRAIRLQVFLPRVRKDFYLHTTRIRIYLQPFYYDCHYCFCESMTFLDCVRETNYVSRNKIWKALDDSRRFYSLAFSKTIFFFLDTCERYSLNL